MSREVLLVPVKSTSECLFICHEAVSQGLLGLLIMFIKAADVNHIINVNHIVL